jgi:hypothetical protein
MKIFSKNIKIKASFIILFVLLILIVFIGIYYWNTDNTDNTDNNTKIGAILGSLIAGLIVATIQFIIAWQDYKQTEKLKELELISVLYDRDNRTFYEEYIKKAKRKINMMGVTGSRFFNDFADDSPDATSNAKVLLAALDRGVKIRILLPEINFVDEHKKQDVEKVKERVASLKHTHPNCSLEIKYFKHIPAHSVFNIDDKCIVGPIFPEVESKYTPALYLRNSSPIADKYIKYFENEWNKAE